MEQQKINRIRNKATKKIVRSSYWARRNISPAIETFDLGVHENPIYFDLNPIGVLQWELESKYQSIMPSYFQQSQVFKSNDDDDFKLEQDNSPQILNHDETDDPVPCHISFYF